MMIESYEYAYPREVLAACKYDPGASFYNKDKKFFT